MIRPVHLLIGAFGLSLIFFPELYARFEPNPTFDTFRTFQIKRIPDEDPGVLTREEAVRHMIARSINKQMKIRNYQKTQKAEILVTFYLDISQEDIEMNSSFYAARPYYYDKSHYFGYDVSNLGTKVAKKTAL